MPGTCSACTIQLAWDVHEDLDVGCARNSAGYPSRARRAADPQHPSELSIIIYHVDATVGLLYTLGSICDSWDLI